MRCATACPLLFSIHVWGGISASGAVIRPDGDRSSVAILASGESIELAHGNDTGTDANTRDAILASTNVFRSRARELQEQSLHDTPGAMSTGAGGSSSNSNSSEVIGETIGNPEKVAMVFLITRLEYLHQLQHSLMLTRENWLAKYPVSSVIVFHSSDIPARDIKNVAESVRVDLQLVVASPTRPDYFDTVQRGGCLCCCNNRPHRGNGKGTLGGRYHPRYCQMNRFRTLDMYRHPALANYDYFVQLDTDLYVQKPLPYNPVERLAASGAVFGFHQKRVFPNATRDCNAGLYEAIAKWIKRSSLSPKYVPPHGTSYCGNFNIGDLRFLRSDRYYDFARWINDEETGIWTHRWGDQAFLPNIIGVYFSEEKALHFSDLFEDEVLVHKSASIGRKFEMMREE